MSEKLNSLENFRRFTFSVFIKKRYLKKKYVFFFVLKVF